MIKFKNGFPSPYGVSFILIMSKLFSLSALQVLKSFRLLTEYHSFLLFNLLYSNDIDELSFRLLTEYHSFLFKNFYRILKIFLDSFRLLTEYHSFLF